MDNIKLVEIVLQFLIIPVGGIVTQVAFKLNKIENEITNRIVRLETMMEFFLKRERKNDDK